MSYFATNSAPPAKCNFCDAEILPFATSYELRVIARPGRDRARRPSIENPSGALVEVWIFDSVACLDSFIWANFEIVKGTG
jgi:hypothetical protein